MVVEIIDLTGSPPPPSQSFEAPKILNFGAASTEQMQCKKDSMPLRSCPNPNFSYTNQQQATMFPSSKYTYMPSQIATGFQPSIYGDQVTTVLNPIPESNTFLFPNGSRLEVPWTPREHELFLMGITKYGRGRWTKIARHFLWNKTPQQVQDYAASFFRHIPTTHTCSFKRRNQTYYAANLMGASAPYSIPLNAYKPQQDRMLSPKEVPIFPIPPYGGPSNNTTRTTFGFQMQTGDASTSASGNGEVDLELRLG